ncbi:unnamed protein product [Urochloa humidicola]
MQGQAYSRLGSFGGAAVAPSPPPPPSSPVLSGSGAGGASRTPAKGAVPARGAPGTAASALAAARAGAGRGGGGGGAARRASRAVLAALLRRQAVFLFAPLLYVAAILLYMGSLPLDAVPRIIARQPPGSVYRSPQLYARLRADMDADNSTDAVSPSLLLPRFNFVCGGLQFGAIVWPY